MAATIVDPAFGIPAFTATIPAGWQMQGSVIAGPACNEIPYPIFRAYAPDGLTEIRRFPRFDWVFHPGTGFAGPADCLPLGGPMSAAEFLDHFLEFSGNDQGARVVGSDTVPSAVRQRAQHYADVVNANNRGPGFHATSDVAAIRVQTVNGSFVVDQRLTAWVECRLREQGPMQGGGCSATVDVLRAPQGQLDALAGQVDAADMTRLVADQQWQSRLMQWLRERQREHMSDLTEQERRSRDVLRRQYEQFSATLQRNHQAYMAQQRTQFENAMRNAAAAMNARGTATSDWVDYALDRQTVAGSGGLARVSSAYSQTWADGQGHWYQTNDPNANPNGALPGTWSRQTRVHGDGSPF